MISVKTLDDILKRRRQCSLTPRTIESDVVVILIWWSTNNAIHLWSRLRHSAWDIVDRKDQQRWFRYPLTIRRRCVGRSNRMFGFEVWYRCGIRIFSYLRTQLKWDDTILNTLVNSFFHYVTRMCDRYDRNVTKISPSKQCLDLHVLYFIKFRANLISILNRSELQITINDRIR